MSTVVRATPRGRIAGLREAMAGAGIDAYLIPSADPHQSEYVPSCWERRRWVSGFTGSAGEVVVTAAAAGLWTDGRYFLQAENQLAGSGIRLYRSGEPGVPSVEAFLDGALRPGQCVGVDPRVLSLGRAEALREALGRREVELRFVDENLVDTLWADRPAPSSAPVTLLARRFAGETSASKIRRVRRAMREHGAHAHLVTTLDAIAWLLNIRGNDVDYNPVVIAYVLITEREVYLFIDRRKLAPAVERQLSRRVRITPYRRVATVLRSLAAKKRTVWLDAASANSWVASALEGATLVRGASPIGAMKARKNATELAGIRAAHVRDGVAMVRFLAWLGQRVSRGGLTEVSAAEQLAAFRAEGEHFRGLSFPTIAGYGAHGAIIHYSADESSALPLEPRGMLLVDSGAQYLDGTTDVTRTILLGGRATREQKDRYTRVLKGHIAIATARFPAGTPGARLDTLARSALWQVGLDYGHGTGHGVGAYLNVHEGPQSISFGRGLAAPLEPGNIQSNEPGYYEPGRFGIRIENLVEVIGDERLARAGRDFLCFHTLTLCPIDTRLVEPRLLSVEERGWLDAYHARVGRELGPLLGPAERRWLRRACARLGP